jgi:hypothetical protein
MSGYYMSPEEIAVLIFVGVASGISYFAGHVAGVSNTVEYLEGEGYLEFEED